MEIDYNGTGKWSVEAVLRRHRAYVRELDASADSDLIPVKQTDGDETRIWPIMVQVIQGIERGESACIAIGVEFIEEEQYFRYWRRRLKTNTARALRRAPLSAEQVERLRNRIVGMLIAGMVPYEFKEYAKLLRRIGLGPWWAVLSRKLIAQIGTLCATTIISASIGDSER